DADLLCGSFNDQVVRWLVDWNFPGAAYPQVWRRTEPPADLAARSEIERRVFDMGYRPTLEQIKNEYDGDWEPVPAAPAAPQDARPEPPDAEPPEGPNFAAPPDDPLAGLIDDAMTKAGEPIEPAAIAEAVKGASSRSDLEARLLALFRDSQRQEFRETLALAEFAAQVLGYADAQDEAQ
ncbi:MAG: DUF935 family protein, partial [Candidatus Competibacteraceae bacterium]|nr:DUF935 family protein [Candidatus Competibacteraceae bacterium]